VLRLHNLGEERDRHGVAGQAREIGCRGVVAGNGLSIGVVDGQAIGVEVVGLEEMQTVGEKVHALHKVCLCPRKRVCNGNRRIVARREHQAV
jgi:hypothetical protein